MSGHPIETPRAGSRDIRRVLTEGTVGGLLGAAASAATLGLCDLATGDALRTPTALGTLLFGEAASSGEPLHSLLMLQLALLYTLAWLLLGAGTAWIVSVAESAPRLWPGVLLERLDRVAVTRTTRRDLLKALQYEERSRALYGERWPGGGRSDLLARLAARADARVAALLALIERFELGADPPQGDGSHPEARTGPANLEEACRRAIELEEEKVAAYDHFLVSIDEPTVHTLFLDLAAESQDRLLPELRSQLASR